ncbi:MAG: hypothetical protein WC091_11575 [Sulfuricellaceae bacterium]
MTLYLHLRRLAAGLVLCLGLSAGAAWANTFALATLTLSCPSPLAAGATGVCSATMNYGDGTTATVSPAWTSANPATLTVDGSGNLAAGTPSVDAIVTISAVHSESGVSYSADAAVTVTASVASALSGLSATCPSTINAGASGTCSTTASYSDGTSKTVSSTWSSLNAAALSVSSGNLVAGTPGADTIVTISADYSENGVSKTATATVTVKATAPALTGLSATCPGTINAGASGTCSATANYSDGTTNTVSPIWRSSNAAILNIDGGGSIVAGIPGTNTAVTISADYSENGVSKTATAAVTVKAATTATLTGLSATCPGTINAGASATCSATASYSDGTTNTVSPAWNSSNTALLSAGSGGSLVAGMPGADAVVTVSASYSENGVSKTATAAVTVKAAVAAALTGLSATCPSTIDAGTSAVCSTTGSYSDGASKVVNATWTSSNTSVATFNGFTVTANAGVTADTPVSLNASYSENGVVRTATVMVMVKTATPATACSGDAKNHSAITIAGSAVKQLGDPLKVDYCLKNFNSATKLDIYVAVQLPDAGMMYLQTSGFFQNVNFTTRVAPYLANTLVPDKSGPVLNIPVLPLALPTGTYTFYAIAVPTGKDVTNSSYWIGTLNKKQVELTN